MASVRFDLGKSFRVSGVYVWNYKDSCVSALVAEVCFANDPFDKIVRETRAGQTKLWTNSDTLNGMRMIFYEGHDGAK